MTGAICGTSPMKCPMSPSSALMTTKALDAVVIRIFYDIRYPM
jgi:hypothetical protein